MRSCQRGTWVVAAVAVAIGFSTGCALEIEPGAEDDAVSGRSLAASRPGPWTLPPDVRRAGESQFVRYDPAGPWRGEAGCSGGLEPGTREFGNFLLGRFRGLDFYGGYSCRPNTGNTSQTSVHGTGRALDLMISLYHGEADNDKGDPVANWLVTNAELAGVQYVIWDRWDWAGARSGRKDGSYGGPIPHTNHIHMELTTEGAARRTDWFRDRDGDGVPSTRDNCPSEPNAGQEDTDGDGVGNKCDNCARAANAGQADDDGDGVGNKCDNCVALENPEQADGDADDVGDRCDNCRAEPNKHQVDTDGDDRGNACDPDDDEDGVPDDMDNCRLVSNAAQNDADGDGVGNACQGDDDGDGVADEADNCRATANPDQADSDGDGRGDACDDSDGDGVPDGEDLCPDVASALDVDSDGDGIGDDCDTDADADAILDVVDVCVDAYDPDQGDTDGDGVGDECDPDADGDDVLDDVDVCPGIANPEQEDADLDGIGDACDDAPTTQDPSAMGVTPDPSEEPDDWHEPAGIVSEASCSASPVTKPSPAPLALIAALVLLGRRARAKRSAPINPRRCRR